VSVSELSEERHGSAAQAFLERMCVARQERINILSRGTSGVPRRRIVVETKGEVLAIASWEVPNRPMYLFAQMRTIPHRRAQLTIY
jgi:hypothetical protein